MLNECLDCNVKLILEKVKKSVSFKDRKLEIEYNVEVCPNCKIEYASVDQASDIQFALAEAYKKQSNKMTAAEMKSQRAEKHLSQTGLAELLNVGVASIKRWESGLVQSRSMDNLLKYHLLNEDCCLNPLSGDREFAINRAKLVLLEFEKNLKIKLLRIGDKLLYSAKYIWYADMIAYRDLGKSMTGATYAALPQGPQLNNYRDLVPHILSSNENDAEPLTEREKKIISRISNRFPKPQQAYNASHNEDAWKMTPIGRAISYRLANTISEFED